MNGCIVTLFYSIWYGTTNGINDFWMPFYIHFWIWTLSILLPFNYKSRLYWSFITLQFIQ